MYAVKAGWDPIQTVLLCKSITGCFWLRLRWRLDDGFFDVLEYLQRAGRPWRRDIGPSDASSLLRDRGDLIWEIKTLQSQRTLAKVTEISNPGI